MLKCLECGSRWYVCCLCVSRNPFFFKRSKAKPGNQAKRLPLTLNWSATLRLKPLKAASLWKPGLLHIKGKLQLWVCCDLSFPFYPVFHSVDFFFLSSLHLCSHVEANSYSILAKHSLRFIRTKFMVIQKLAQRPIVARERKKKEIQVGNIILTKARTIE